MSTTEEIKNIFNNRVRQDYDTAINNCLKHLMRYCEELKLNPHSQDIKDKIAVCVYRWATLEDLKIAIESASLNSEQIKALLVTTKPQSNIFWNIYDEWQKNDCTIVSEMQNTIEDYADKGIQEQEINSSQKESIRDDYIR